MVPVLGRQEQSPEVAGKGGCGEGEVCFYHRWAVQTLSEPQLVGPLNGNICND